MYYVSRDRVVQTQLQKELDEELDKARAAVARMVHRAIALDGTCTGEHGVGMGKRDYLYEELGEGTVELMKTIKKAVDPLNLFNPGKVRVIMGYDAHAGLTFAHHLAIAVPGQAEA